MRRAILLVGLLSLVSRPAAAQPPDHGLAGNDAILPSSGVAVQDGLLSLYANPAGLALRPGEFGLLYSLGLHAGTDVDALGPQFETRFTGDWSAVAGGRLAFGVDHRDLPAGYAYSPDGATVTDRPSNRYSLGLAQGFEFPRFELQLGLGAAYRWTRSDAYALDGLSTWDLGAMLRWQRWFSVGLSARNVDRPRLRGLEPGDSGSVAPSYVFGLGLRPRRDGISFSVDVAQREVADRWEYTNTVGVDMDLGGRSHLRFDWSDDSRFALAFSVALGPGRAGLAVANRYGESEGTRRGSLGLELSNRDFARPLLPRRHFLDLTLAGAPSERGSTQDPLDGTEAMLDALAQAREARDLAGVLLRLRQPALTLTQREDLHRALLDFRRLTGLPVVVYAHEYSAEDYYLASAASDILLDADGLLRFDGLASAPPGRGPTDTAALPAALVSLAPRNSAPARLSGVSLSPDAHAADSTLAESFLLTVARGVAEGRRLPVEDVPDLLSRGLLSPDAALSRSLVDALVPPDSLGEWLDAAKSQRRLLDWRRFARRDYARRRWGLDPAFAVIHVDGLLVEGEDGLGLFGPETGSEALARRLAAARRDPRIRGVLLRVNSGGGSALAAESMRLELRRTRRVKPVVVSMAGAGAGGAYLLSLDADRILASRSTVTAGIGLWGGRLDSAALADRLGLPLTPRLAPDGRAALGLTPGPPALETREREQLEDELARRYQDFVAVAAERRYISEPEVDLMGRGRPWSGADALQNGFVDEIGGKHAALAALRRLARVAPGQEIRLQPMPAPPARPGLWRRLLRRERQRATGPGLLPAEGESLAAWTLRVDPFPDAAVLSLDASGLAAVSRAPLR